MKKLTLILILNIFAISGFAQFTPKAEIAPKRVLLNTPRVKALASTPMQKRAANVQAQVEADTKLGTKNYELKGQTDGDKLGSKDYELKNSATDNKLGNKDYELKGENNNEKLGVNNHELKNSSTSNNVAIAGKAGIADRGERGIAKGDKGANKGDKGAGKSGKSRSK
ncbi:MAG: hypothetical protein R3Y46_00895 [Opitutales bacterium]